MPSGRPKSRGGTLLGARPGAWQSPRFKPVSARVFGRASGRTRNGSKRLILRQLPSIRLWRKAIRGKRSTLPDNDPRKERCQIASADKTGPVLAALGLGERNKASSREPGGSRFAAQRRRSRANNARRRLFTIGDGSARRAAGAGAVRSVVPEFIEGHSDDGPSPVSTAAVPDAGINEARHYQAGRFRPQRRPRRSGGHDPRAPLICRPTGKAAGEDGERGAPAS